MADLSPLDIASTPVDDAEPDDPSRISVEAGLLEDVEDAKALDTTVEVIE